MVQQKQVRDHQPVLLAQAIQALNIQADGFYIDATYGRGGHSAGILARLGRHGRLLAFDKDPAAIAHGQEIFAKDPRFEIRRGSFTQLHTLREEKKEQISGILFDLGVSSPQLDSAERGFSFYHDGALDMRMDPTQGMSAAEWLRAASEKEIATILRKYGEERNAKRIARKIKETPIPVRTLELAQRVVDASTPLDRTRHHPATRTFLAIRLYLNQELEELKEALFATLGLLTSGGRLVVISFHSLEDRVVKQFIQEFSRGSNIPRKLPITSERMRMSLRQLGKSVVPDSEEVKHNPRARSARLRCAEKTGVPA